MTLQDQLDRAIEQALLDDDDLEAAHDFNLLRQPRAGYRFVYVRESDEMVEGFPLPPRPKTIEASTAAYLDATAKEKRRLGVSVKQPYFVSKQARVIRKGSPYLTRDAYTVKKHGMHRRALAEFRATPEGATHPEHGYKRPPTGKLAELLRKRRYNSAKAKAARLELVRHARAAFERDGDDIAARVQAARDEFVSAEVKHARDAQPWTGFKDQLDEAIGPDTGAAVASRQLPGDGRIADGNWHGLIDALTRIRSAKIRRW